MSKQFAQQEWWKRRPFWFWFWLHRPGTVLRSWYCWGRQHRPQCGMALLLLVSLGTFTLVVQHNAWEAVTLAWDLGQPGAGVLLALGAVVQVITMLGSTAGLLLHLLGSATTDLPHARQRLRWLQIATGGTFVGGVLAVVLLVSGCWLLGW